MRIKVDLESDSYYFWIIGMADTICSLETKNIAVYSKPDIDPLIY